MKNKIIFMAMAMMLYAIAGSGQATVVVTGHTLFPDATFDQFMPSIAVNKVSAPGLIATYSTNCFDSCSQRNYQGFYFSPTAVNSCSPSCLGDNTTMPNFAQSHGWPSISFDGAGNGFMMGENGDGTGFFVVISSDGGNSWVSPTINTHVTPAAKIFYPKAAADDLNVSSNTNAGNYYVAWEDDEDFLSGGDYIHTAVLPHGTSAFGTAIELTCPSGVPNKGPCVATGPAINALGNPTDNGAVYICWSVEGAISGGYGPQNGTSIGFATSTDGGSTYTSYLPGTSTPMGFVYNGIAESGYAEDALYNNTTINGYPSMAVDKGCGPNSHRGRIYIVAAEQVLTSGSVTGSDISLWFSDDGGQDWAGGVYSHIGSGSVVGNVSSASGMAFCWLPAVAVDDLTGIVSVVYYGSSSPVGTNTTNTFVSFSTPGADPGLASSWSGNVVTVSTAGQTVQDYPWNSCNDHFPLVWNTRTDGGSNVSYVDNIGNGIAAYNGHAYPAWVDRSTGLRQIWAADIQYSGVTPLTSSETTAKICVSTIVSQSYEVADEIGISVCGGEVSVGSSGSPANVSTKAGQSIIIGQGFVTTPGSVFTAEIGATNGCQTPGVQTFDKTNTPNTTSVDNTVTSTTVNSLNVYAYPNPTSNLITVGTSNNNYQNVSFVVTDISGRTISKYNSTSISGSDIQQIIDASSFAEGLYIVTMIADNQKYSFKFAKE